MHLCCCLQIRWLLGDSISPEWWVSLRIWTAAGERYQCARETRPLVHSLTKGVDRLVAGRSRSGWQKTRKRSSLLRLSQCLFVCVKSQHGIECKVTTVSNCRASWEVKWRDKVVVEGVVVFQCCVEDVDLSSLARPMDQPPNDIVAFRLDQVSFQFDCLMVHNLVALCKAAATSMMYDCVCEWEAVMVLELLQLLPCLGSS